MSDACTFLIKRVLKTNVSCRLAPNPPQGFDDADFNCQTAGHQSVFDIMYHYFYRLTPSLTIQDEFDFSLTSTTVDDFEPSSPRALFPDPGHTGMDVGTAPTGMFDLINLYSLLTLLLKINYKKDIDGLFPVGYFSQKMSNSDTGYAPL